MSSEFTETCKMYRQCEMNKCVHTENSSRIFAQFYFEKSIRKKMSLANDVNSLPFLNGNSLTFLSKRLHLLESNQLFGIKTEKKIFEQIQSKI